jgi:hypothetical protein
MFHLLHHHLFDDHFVAHLYDYCLLHRQMEKVHEVFVSLDDDEDEFYVDEVLWKNVDLHFEYLGLIFEVL